MRLPVKMKKYKFKCVIAIFCKGKKSGTFPHKTFAVTCKLTSHSHAIAWLKQMLRGLKASYTQSQLFICQSGAR